MEIVIEFPQDIDKLCRTCLTIIKEDERRNSVLSQEEQINDLCKMLKYVTGMKVTPDDGLPTVMCDNCINKLRVSYMFKEQCEQTYLNLKEFTSSVAVRLCDDKRNLTSESNSKCSTCFQSFASHYKLSKHAVEHYENQSLLSRYFASREQLTSSDYLACDQEKHEINANASLIEERKIAGNKNVIFKIDDGNFKQINNNNKMIHRNDGYVSNFTSRGSKLKTTANSEIQNGVSETIKMCDLCDRIFSNDLALSLHFVKHALLAESDTDPNIFDQYIYCENCGETFDDKEVLKVHNTDCTSNRSQQHECLKCALAFDSELSLLKHEKLVDHNGDYIWDEFLTKSVVKDTYTCPVCNESFSNKNDLNMHSVTHVIKKVLCRICKKLFCTHVAYNDHLRVHPNYKHFCELCGKCLGSKHALKMHVMGVHSVAKNYICPVCSKGFKTPGRLHIHKLTHKEDKKFGCSYCMYRTNNLGDFKVHTRIHTSERPYKCNFVNCTKRFKTSSHLNEHIQRHLQIKKFQCNMCEMVFGHSHTLKMHIMVHTGEKPFSCELCKAKFRRKHHLKNHMRQHANAESVD